MMTAVDLHRDLAGLPMLKERYGHPTDAESLQSEGATRFDILVDAVMQSLELSAGMLVVVPQGCWHRFDSESGVKVLTVTPKPTQHTHVEEPRAAVVDD